MSYNLATHTLSFSIPPGLRVRAARKGIGWLAIIAAFVKFGPPLVLAVLQDYLSGNWSNVLQLITEYGLPLVQAIAAALGIVIPVGVKVRAARRAAVQAEVRTRRILRARRRKLAAA